MTKVEPYTRKLGHLAMKLDGKWVVVAPSGTVLKRCGDDEAEARSYAQFYNLTTDLAFAAIVL